jgi:hypothetical protein
LGEARGKQVLRGAQVAKALEKERHVEVDPPLLIRCRRRGECIGQIGKRMFGAVRGPPPRLMQIDVFAKVP